MLAEHGRRTGLGSTGWVRSGVWVTSRPFPHRCFLPRRRRTPCRWLGLGVAGHRAPGSRHGGSRLESSQPRGGAGGSGGGGEPRTIRSPSVCLGERGPSVSTASEAGFGSRAVSALRTRLTRRLGRAPSLTRPLRPPPDQGARRSAAPARRPVCSSSGRPSCPFPPPPPSPRVHSVPTSARSILLEYLPVCAVFHGTRTLILPKH